MMEVPNLQLQCLYLVVGRLETYSSQTVALLPTFLKYQLLSRLPVADICRLENNDDFMISGGLSTDSIWSELLEHWMKLNTKALGDVLDRHPSAKEGYLSQVAQLIVTDERKRSEYKFPFLGSYYRNESSPESDEEPSDFACESKSELIAYLLFGTHLKFDDIAVKTHLFAKRYSLGTTWLIPLRYFGETTFTDPLEIAKKFIDTLDWYPNRLDFPCDDCLDKGFKFGNSKILQSFLSRVETITVDYEDRQFFRFHPPVKTCDQFETILFEKRDTVGTSYISLRP